MGGPCYSIFLLKNGNIPHIKEKVLLNILKISFHENLIISNILKTSTPVFHIFFKIDFSKILQEVRYINRFQQDITRSKIH